MHTVYFFSPENSMIHHCSESFYQAMMLNTNSIKDVKYIDHATFKDSIKLVREIVASTSEDRVSIFFFLIEFDYLLLSVIVKVIEIMLSKNVTIHYMMHEPRFERGRVSYFKGLLVFIYHFLFGHVADKILLPSNEAFAKAQSFIQFDKLCKINLSFISPPDHLLEQNLVQLSCSWEESLTFSLLGRADIDKNPQGFLLLAEIINRHHPQRARFIRGGLDRNLNLKYDEDLIVRFPVFMSTSVKKLLFSLTHFIVVPYSFSTQSGVIAESLSYGKLIIANDIPSFSYLKDLPFVFLINFNDEKAILNCMDKLFTMDKKDYKKLYWQAIKYFQENHSETYISKILDREILIN